MTTTKTLRVSASAYDYIRRLATENGLSTVKAVDHVVEVYQDERFWERAREQVAQSKQKKEETATAATA